MPRSKDEVMCTEVMNLGTNRGNYLLLNMLKYRFPNISDQLKYVRFNRKSYNLCDESSSGLRRSEDNQMCVSLILSYVLD